MHSEHVAPHPPWVAPELFPFSGRFVDAGGHRLHYIDEGRGPTILFLHAAPAWCGYFRELILALRGGFRCVALDLPGFGLSLAGPHHRSALREHSQAVEAFMAALALRDVVLLAHDSGGPIGLGVAARQPRWFRAFVLTSTFAWPLADYPAVRRMLRLVGSRPFSALNAALNLLPRAMSRFAPRRRRLTRAERRAITGAFRTWAQRRRMTALMGDLARDDDYLRGVEAALRGPLSERPALIVYGEVDPARQAGFDRHFERLCRRHRSVVIAGEQHFAHLAAADEIAQHVRDFLSGLTEDGRESLSA
jgi:haloalkane dehalogenase